MSGPRGGNSRKPFSRYIDAVKEWGLVGGEVSTEQSLLNVIAMNNAIVDAYARQKYVFVRPSGTDIVPERGYQMGSNMEPMINTRIEGDHKSITRFQSHPEFLANGPIFSQRRTFDPTTYWPETRIRIGNITFDGNWRNNAEFQRKLTLAEPLTAASTSAVWIEKDVLAEMPQPGRISFHEGDTGSNNPDFTYTTIDVNTGTMYGLVWLTNSHSAPGNVPAGSVFYDHLHSSLGVFHVNTFDDLFLDDCDFMDAGGYLVAVQGQLYENPQVALPKKEFGMRRCVLDGSHHSDCMDAKYIESIMVEDSIFKNSRLDKALNVRGMLQRYSDVTLYGPGGAQFTGANKRNPTPWSQGKSVVNDQPDQVLTLLVSGNVDGEAAAFDQYDNWEYAYLGPEIVKYAIEDIPTTKVRLVERGCFGTRPAYHAVWSDDKPMVFSPIIPGESDDVDSTIDATNMWAIDIDANGIAITGSGAGLVTGRFRGGGALRCRRGFLANDSVAAVSAHISDMYFKDCGNPDFETSGSGIRLDSCIHSSIHGTVVQDTIGDGLQLVNMSNGGIYDLDIMNSTLAGVRLQGSTDYVEIRGNINDNAAGNLVDSTVVA